MIKVTVRLWTNEIAAKKGQIVQKHAWAEGVVYMQRNSSHGIKPYNPKHFRSMRDVGRVIEEVLKEQGIVLHANPRMRPEKKGQHLYKEA
jgi:hypothetical protein